MNNDVATAIISTLTAALPIAAAEVAHVPRKVQRQAQAAVGPFIGEVAQITVDGREYLACRYHHQHRSIVVLGPFRTSADQPADVPLLAEDDRERASAALRAASRALQQIHETERQRIELANQLEVTSRSVLAITSELGLDTVLNRIVDLARELSGARYAALGVPGPDGDLETFLTSGMTFEQESRISHRPRGLGLLGLLLHEPRTLRLEDIHEHPSSVGFPANHPPMTSFLGVPIMSHGQMLGNLYLTEKRTAGEFTDADARLVEVLAKHASVAIENARLYRKLEEQQQRLRLALDQLPEATVLAESNPDRVSLSNQHADDILGWDIKPPLPLEEFLRRNARYSPDGTEMSYDDIPIVRSIRYGESISRKEVLIERPDGRRYTILINSVPLISQENRITGAIVVFQDVTQIKDAEQLKDDFLSLVSHELRTPLTTIQGGALLLQRDWAMLDLDTQQDILADIAIESRRLGGLIENMVQLANIRAGRMRMETEPVLMGRLIEQACAAVRLIAPEREFRASVDDRLLAEADEQRIDQVLRNLLQNAVKYSPSNTPIYVRARRVDDLVEVRVRDEGPGIDDLELPHIFERFHRTAATRASNTPGMGLGLYLSRHVIEAHGGQIWIERPDEGGTCVSFTLPAIDEPDS